MSIVLSSTSGLNTVNPNFEPKYFIKDQLRFVTPYIYTYQLYAKQRWIDRKLGDVLKAEFGAYDDSYYMIAIKKGYIKVNHQNVTWDYKIQSSDFIEHKLLLFEKPILNKKIHILYEDQNFICVHKPASLPTHPVGFYQYNSLLKILQNHLNIQHNIKHSTTFGDVVKVHFPYQFKETAIHTFGNKKKYPKKKCLHKNINQRNCKQSAPHERPKYNEENNTENPENKENRNKNKNEYNMKIEESLYTKDKELYIYTLHRLDKYTSGIVFFGKNKDFSSSFSQSLEKNKIRKTYITRVDGDFRSIIKKLWDEKKVFQTKENTVSIRGDLQTFIQQYIDNNRKLNEEESVDTHQKNSFIPDRFLCENKFATEKNQYGDKINELIQSVINQREELKDLFDIDKYKEEYLRKEVETKKDVEQQNEFIYNYFLIDFGYMTCLNKKLLHYVFVKGQEELAEYIKFYPFCNKNVKEYLLRPTITKFMFLSYNEELNESLIICQPITGRTHQIRAHLKHMQFPISNDLNYNETFQQQYMHQSRYLYFNEQTKEEHIQKEKEKNVDHSENQKKKKETEKYTYYPLIPFINTSFSWLYDDTIDLNKEYEEQTIQTYFFNNLSNITYHSSGIFLHSFRYTWNNILDIFTLFPKWCSPFEMNPNILIFLLYGNLSHENFN